MQQETTLTNQVVSQQMTAQTITEPQLVNLIKKTYTGSSTSIVKQSQETLMNLLLNDAKTITHIFSYLRPPFNSGSDLNFRVACSILLKKCYYKISENETLEKSNYISLCYEVLTSPGVDKLHKEQISVGLQYIFNKDQLLKYKNDWVDHFHAQILAIIENPQAWSLDTLEVLFGLVLGIIAYMNSLVEPEEQVEFVSKVMGSLCAVAVFVGEFVGTKIGEDGSVKGNGIWSVAVKVFEFVQICAERLFEQQQLIPQELQKFKENEKLKNIIHMYLYMFCENNSIISNMKSLNEVKITILNILEILIENNVGLELPVLELIFSTFIKEQDSLKKWEEDDNDEGQKILCRIISILEKEMVRKNNEKFFIEHKVNILFAMFSYSRTGLKQFTYIYEEPQKFSQIADEFTQCFHSSPLVKVRISNLIRVFVSRIDEGLSSLIELCVIFITGSLSEDAGDTELLRQAKQIYSQFSFMGMGSRQKLDISFMVLCVVCGNLQSRPDLKVIISSILITNMNTVCKITDELVLLRVVRLIGYFPTSVYFAFMQNLMAYSKAFVCQGLIAFNRISKNKEYLEIFPIMHLVYLNLLEYLEVNDPIFEGLIVENYEKVLRQNPALYEAVLKKIFVSFSGVGSSKNNCVLALNWIESMLRKQKSQKYLKMIEDTYLKMEEIGIKEEILYENFISIYEVLVTKNIIISQRIQQFGVVFSSPEKLKDYPQHSQFFKFLNKLIVKIDNTKNLEMIYNNLVSYLSRTHMQHFNYQIVPQVTHCIGHLILTCFEINLDVNFLKFLINVMITKVAKGSQLSVQQSWYSFLVFQLVYQKAAFCREHLVQCNLYYPFMISLLNYKTLCRIQRKAIILALQELLLYETDFNCQLEILKVCIVHLNIQKNKYEKRRTNDKKVRRRGKITQEEEEEQAKYSLHQESMHNDSYVDKDKDGIYFKDFKHPFDKIDEFSMFKRRLMGLQNFNKFNEQILPGISEILKYEWHQDHVRRIFKILQE